jgi:flagellar hook-associated protein 2
VGFSAKARQVADSLAAVGTGALLNRTSTLNNQIEQNNERVASMDLRLDRQRNRLLKQFYDMELTIARLQQNLSALNQLQVIPPISRTRES